MNKYLFISFAALVACGVEDEMAVDGEHDRYIIDGKTDTGGIQEGTDDAFGVLAVVNTLTQSQLVSDVTIASTAASNIAAYRRGDDETAGTADDQQFETLAELDSIPYVGPVAFARLLTYARNEGYTDDPPILGGSDDPFDPNACAGAPLSQTSALARIQANEATLGAYQLAIRHKVCTAGTNSTCSWKPVPLADIYWRGKADGQLVLAEENGEVNLEMRHDLCDLAGVYTAPIPQFVDGTTCTGIGSTVQCGQYGYPAACKGSWASFDPYELPNGYGFVLDGKVTENCAQLYDRKGNYDEYEVAILVRY